MPELTSIVIVTFNQLACTKLCLESICKGTDSAYELIVVDNGSSDGTTEYLRQQRGVTLIENPENRGFPAAANQGIAASSGDFVLLLNNDVVVPRGWLGRLMRPFADHADLGLAGPVSNSVSGPQQIPVTYTDLADLERFATERAASHHGQLQFVPRLVGFCLLFRRQVIEKIGRLDERFGIGNFEDDDFCRRATQAGFQAGIVADAYVHHFGSVTFRAAQVNLGSLLAKNRQIFEEKWLPTKSGAVKLSLCMIVRDSAKTLPACLASIRPWVDEMIVIDTGSVDNTREIARSSGAAVHDFPWCDSFAAARNQSLGHAKGQWLFWMDSDDTIDEANGRKLRELIDHAPPQTMAYIMQVHCPADADDPYGTATVVDHVKAFRNDPAIRFTGRIHEQVLPAIRRLSGAVQWTDIFVVHSGSDGSAEGRKRKFARDLRLLELELADDPDSTFALFNLGMTLVHSGRSAEAVNALCRSLQLAGPKESHIRKVYALLAAAYAQLGRPQTALKTCLQGLAACRGDPELLFRKAVVEQALGELAQAEKTLLSLLEPAQRGRHFSSIDRGIVGIKAWHNLASVYTRQGRMDKAAAAWRRVVELDAKSLGGWRGLVNALTNGQDQTALAQIGEIRGVPPEIELIAHARLLCLRGQVAGAVDELSQAMNRNASTQLLDELCRLTFEHDRLDDARHWLGELARQRPDDPSAHLNLATVLLRLNQRSDAAEHARWSLAIRPDYPPALDILRKAEGK